MKQGFDWITEPEAAQLLIFAFVLSHLLHAFVWAEIRRDDRWRVKEAIRRRNEALNALADGRHQAGLQRRLRPAELNEWSAPQPVRHRLELPLAAWPGRGGVLPVTYGPDLDLDAVTPFGEPPALPAAAEHRVTALAAGVAT